MRKSEAGFANAQRIAHLGNWEWDIREDKLYWSDELYRIFGLSPDTFTPTYKVFLSFVHGDDRESVKNLFVNLSVRESLILIISVLFYQMAGYASFMYRLRS